MTTTRDRISVVMLTYNRASDVLQSLERIHALPENPRVVLVDNASRDGTREQVLQRFPEVEVVRLRRNLGAAARNAGVKRATTPYVVLCDDDVWWAPGSLERAADLFDAYPRLAIITAKVLVGPDERVDPTCHLMAESPLVWPSELPGPPLLGFLAGASAVRRDAFLEVGGFEPRLFLGAEERLLAVDLVSAGWAMAYVDTLVAHHHPSPARDAPGRRRLLARNELWFAWLRRPARAALRDTLQTLRSARSDATKARGLVDAALGLPWVLRRRDVLSADVEAMLRLLERQAA
jgi:GT2 family glycosyltransferase